MTYIADPLVMPIAEEMLACYEAALQDTGTVPRYIGFRPGTVVDWLLSTLENECCDGLAWIRPVTFFPSSAVFPQQDSAPVPKGTRAWAVTLELGAVRCSPTPDETVLPQPDVWNAVVQQMMDDGAAMRRAICCYIDMDPVRRFRTVLPGAWVPLNVEGGCVGGALTVTIQGPACDCSEEGGS